MIFVPTAIDTVTTRRYLLYQYPGALHTDNCKHTLNSSCRDMYSDMDYM